MTPTKGARDSSSRLIPALPSQRSRTSPARGREGRCLLLEDRCDGGRTAGRHCRLVVFARAARVDQIFRQERLHHCHAVARTWSSWGCDVSATSRCSRGPAYSPHPIALGRAVQIERCSFIRTSSASSTHTKPHTCCGTGAHTHTYKHTYAITHHIQTNSNKLLVLQ